MPSTLGSIGTKASGMRKRSQLAISSTISKQRCTDHARYGGGVPQRVLLPPLCFERAITDQIQHARRNGGGACGAWSLPSPSSALGRPIAPTEPYAGSSSI